MAEDFASSLARSRQGDRAALEELFARWRPLLRLEARRLLGADLAARLDPSDVVQESLAQAFRDLPGFRGQTTGEWVAWLRRIVAGQAARARRRHRADCRSPDHEIVAPGELADDIPAPGANLVDEEEAARLAAALEQLPAAMREVVVRRVFDEQPFEALARDMGCSPGAARVTWTRAIARLRQILDEQRSDRP
jgi:RNA polymerase sigma-70 factor (ECF subfamily)